MRTIHCPATGTQCPNQRCISKRAQNNDWFCPRTIAERKAMVTKAEYERKEAEALKRIHAQMYNKAGGV